jgi:cysteine desulfurase
MTMLRTPIYLDNNATTKIDPRVLETMLPFLTEFYGNAASRSHSFGGKASEAVDRARESIARSLNARSPQEIVFTSGATEADNLAVKGVAEACAGRGDHIITATTEHKAVLDSCHALERRGFRVTYLDVDRDGLVDLNALADAITPKTILVSLMLANNETGVIQDIAAIGRLCRERGVLFHTDATQGVGKIPFDAQATNVDLASFTAHKIYGPKGAGALYVRSGEQEARLAAQMDGGGHEGGFRSGTLNVPGIVGLAKALELCLEERETEIRRLTSLRERLKEGLQNSGTDIRLNGHPTRRLPGTLNLAFPGVESESLLADLPDVALSPGAACTSGSRTPSYVLKAMGLPDELAFASVRFSLGRYNTEEEIDFAARRVSETARRLRGKAAM